MYDAYSLNSIPDSGMPSGSVAVQLHLYYEDLKKEFFSYLSNIPFQFDLYISCREGVNANKLGSYFKKLKNVKNVCVKATQNRGRDIAPLYVLFRKEILSHKYFLHIHSKKSLYSGTERVAWRQKSLNMLLGSPSAIRRIFYMFERKNAGLIYPDAFEFNIPIVNSWLANKDTGMRLLEKLSLKYDEESFFSYPAGSFFWARTDAVKKLFLLNFEYEDFPEEAGQTDGTLAHALERVIAFASRGAGFDNLILDEDNGLVRINESDLTYRQIYDTDKDNLFEYLTNFDTISFDVFDTLITRKILRPDDIFLWLEKRTGIKDYLAIRKKAEGAANAKYGAKTTIEEIYAEFPVLLGIDKKRAAQLMAEEIACEKQLCVARRDMLWLAKRLHKAGKKLILVSDMYLPAEIISDLLENCGYEKSLWSDVYVSCDIGARKDGGTIWDIVAKKYPIMRKEKFIHLGDNMRSDYQLVGDRKMSAFFIPSGRALCKMSQFYDKLKGTIHKSLSIEESFYLGLLINVSLFNSPFCVRDGGIVRVQPFETGYAVFGPVMAAFCCYLIQSTKKTEKLLFLAREGKLLQKYYRLFCKNAGVAEAENEYFYGSRRAVGMASLFNDADALSMLLNSTGGYSGRIDRLFYARFGYKISETDAIELPKDRARVETVFSKYAKEIFSAAAKEREAYLAYTDRVFEDESKEYTVVDLGYAGTMQYFLSRLLNRKIGGKYLVCSKEPKPLALHCSCDSLYKYQGDWARTVFLRYSLMLESMLKIECGQLIKFQKTENGIEPVFGKVDYLTESEKILQKGAERFVGDLAALLNGSECRCDTELTEKIFEVFFACDTVQAPVLDKLFVEDSFTNAVKFLRYDSKTHTWVRTAKIRRYAASVVVPFDDDTNLIEALRNNLFGQAFADFEVIFVGSSECGAGLKKIRKIKKETGRVKILSEREYARNDQERALRNSEGEYICFLRKGDVIGAGELQRACLRAEKNRADFVLLRCGVHGKNDSGGPLGIEAEELGEGVAFTLLSRADLLEKQKLFSKKKQKVLFRFANEGYFVNGERSAGKGKIVSVLPLAAGEAPQTEACAERDRLRAENAELKKHVSNVYRSFSFRCGRFITWFPRKVRGALRCLKNKGLRYTLVRFFRGRLAAESYEKRKTE